MAWLVFFVWYPGPFGSMAGGTGLFGIMVGVDVVLGPLITLIVFSERKPRRELLADLTIVVVIQLSALIYGLSIVYHARPAVLALEEDRFRMVSAMDVRHEELPAAREEFRSLSLAGPRLVDAEVPTEPLARSEATWLALRGYDVGARPSLWRPWNATARQAALSRAKPLYDLLRRSPRLDGKSLLAVEKSGLAVDQLVYLPVIARKGDWVALMDRGTGEVVGFAPLSGF